MRQITVDGNEAVASVAYRGHEVIAIYPITPASPMGELADAWAAAGRTNLWGTVPTVSEMQSEGGAAGAVHGSLLTGALTTTFTASQGLLLMLPNLFKIAGELTPFVLHVAARSVATHALSIFCDHSDVMAARQTGFALLASNSVQEAQDFALIAQMSTLASRVPILHFLDGFRTSHEVAKITALSDEELRALLDDALVRAHRERGLTPDHPVVRGTAQNPDTFFQAREACNRFYDACPGLVEDAMDAFALVTGRRYRLFQYHGHPEAERVLVLMGSAAETVHETVDHLVARDGAKVGVLQVHLYRPFSVEHFAAALPPTVRGLAVLDRTKEPGAVGEPLYLDVSAAVRQATAVGLAPWQEEPVVIGGRYGLSSKEFDPACVCAVFDHLQQRLQHGPRRDGHALTEVGGFTVGIVDDVTHRSLAPSSEQTLDIEPPKRVRAVFFGLGSDGTVSANKNSIKIIGKHTEHEAQGYFVYDSKKAGAVTISHLRFGPEPIRSAYLIRNAGFVACHQFDFLDRYDVLGYAAPGATVLLNAPHPEGQPQAVWDQLPREVQQQVLDKGVELYVIDAYRVAREAGLGVRINTIMQTCFFALSGVLPRERAIAEIKAAIETAYGKRGPVVARQNFAAVDQALAHLHRIETPSLTSERHLPPIVPAAAPDFVQRVTALMLAQKGDLLPVSAFPVDGTWPTATSQWEKRNIALDIPVWEPDVCIQCNQCALACPHAAIRAKVYPPEALTSAGNGNGAGSNGRPPEGFLSTAYKAKDLEGLAYTLQVAPEDCTGCGLCVAVCPAKDRSNPRRKAINMVPQRPLRDAERERYRFFLDLPELDRKHLPRLDAKGSQFLQPLFEYSGACAGCGETPYIKLLTQLFGDRLLIANGTGCSSIFGGNLPTTPYTVNADGRGPAWANSLFEDNAEFGMGFRLALDNHVTQARHQLSELARESAAASGDRATLPDTLVAELLDGSRIEVSDEAGLEAQRQRVDELKRRLAQLTTAATATDSPQGRALETALRNMDSLAEYLVPKCVWLVGGDGWAYDIGYGGLDHVLSLPMNLNVLVLDTEVYSNTGGQASKATPLGAAAKFAAAGKETSKKDLGLEMMSYGHVYVARIAFGAKVNQTVEALREAAAYPGPSLVIAYSHCIAHGYHLSQGAEQQKRAVTAGIWPLYRFDPRRIADGKPPLQLDSGAPKGSPAEYMRAETRFRLVEKQDPGRFRNFITRTEQEARSRRSVYEQLAGLTVPLETAAREPAATGPEQPAADPVKETTP